MACSRCDFKGFIESFVFRDAGMKPSLEQCRGCMDTEAYSKEVQRRHKVAAGIAEPLGEPAKVIPFQRKSS